MGIRNALEGKRAWRSYRARIKALPQDYQIVFEEVEKYLMKVCGAQGLAYDSTLSGVLEFFEESADLGKGALDVIGTDVATFCDDLL